MISVQPETGFMITQSYGFSSKFNMKTSSAFSSQIDTPLFPENMILAFPDLDSAPKQFDAFSLSESMKANEDSFNDNFEYVTSN